jgi:hypothetical protein
MLRPARTALVGSRRSDGSLKPPNWTICVAYLDLRQACVHYRPGAAALPGLILLRREMDGL